MTHALARCRWPILSLLIAVGIPVPVMAESFGSLDTLSQERFIQLSKNLSAAFHYKALGPAEPLGTLGLDIGVEVSSTEIDEALFDDASDGDFETKELIVPRIHVNKGLPFGFDLGATLSAVPDTDISIIAGEIRYALINGGALTPSVALRASHSQLQGLTDFDIDSSALEITASKGVFMLTPYAGAGIVRSNANPGRELNNLAAETFEQDKVFVGLTINLGFALTLEADRTGDLRTYSAKAGIRF